MGVHRGVPEAAEGDPVGCGQEVGVAEPVRVPAGLRVSAGLALLQPLDEGVPEAAALAEGEPEARPL